LARGVLGGGAGGIDQVWARLTAGEFVLSPESTAVLGPELLGLMNSEPHRFARLRDERRERRREAIAFVAEPAVREDVRGTAGTEPAAAGDEIHYHGGITVQVQRPTELGPVLRELESRGVQLRVRRG